MINIDDVNEDAVVRCFELLHEHHDDFDVRESDVWFKAWKDGFTCCKIPNFSNIYMEILFQHTHDMLKEKGINSTFYIDNQDSYFEVIY